jgi:hypothetical protein
MPCDDWATCNEYLRLGCHWCKSDEHNVMRESERADMILGKDLEVKRVGLRESLS